MSITVVVPVYNAEKTIGRLGESLVNSLKTHKLQVVLVNDGSQDKSHDVCLELINKYPSIFTYLQLAKNFGEHNAVLAGLHYAKGDYTVIMDDDFQNSPEEAMLLVEAARAHQYDLVYGFYDKKQHGFFRNLGSRFNNWVANYMLDKPKDLYLCSFKCLSKFIVEQICKYDGPFPYIDGLVLRCTRNIGKVEVKHHKRQSGRSGYTFEKLVQLWLNMFINFSISPVRLSVMLGFFASAAAVLLSIYVILEKISNPQLPIGWPSMVIIIMFFAGVQLLILGLLGEYIGRLFLSNNKTPQFVIRNAYGADKDAKNG
jgi:glycosyltransferase involved in cell wall biosynthesis